MYLEGSSCITYHDRVFLFGGKDLTSGIMSNDVYTVRCGELANESSSFVNFQRLNTSGTSPSPRCYHSAALRSQFMVVVGGQCIDEAGDSSPDDLVMYSLNLENDVWTKYYVPIDDASGKIPPRMRCHATLVSTTTSLLLYGGFPTAEGAALEPNHWCVFEIGADASIKQIKPEGQFPLLWGHTAIHSHNCLMLFGGVDGPGCNEVSTLCVFHQDERRWRWAEFPHAPDPRLLHTAIQWSSKMIIYGGFASHRLVDGTCPQFSDVWAFSLNTGLWEKVETTGDVPPRPRSGHCSVVHQNSMFAIGGLEGNDVNLDGPPTVGILNLQTGVWREKELAIDGTSFSHKGAAGDDYGAVDAPPRKMFGRSPTAQTSSSLFPKQGSPSGGGVGGAAGRTGSPPRAVSPPKKEAPIPAASGAGAGGKSASGSPPRKMTLAMYRAAKANGALAEDETAPGGSSVKLDPSGNPSAGSRGGASQSPRGSPPGSGLGGLSALSAAGSPYKKQQHQPASLSSRFGAGSPSSVGGSSFTPSKASSIPTMATGASSIPSASPLPGGGGGTTPGGSGAVGRYSVGQPEASPSRAGGDPHNASSTTPRGDPVSRAVFSTFMSPDAKAPGQQQQQPTGAQGSQPLGQMPSMTASAILAGGGGGGSATGGRSPSGYSVGSGVSQDPLNKHTKFHPPNQLHQFQPSPANPDGSEMLDEDETLSMVRLSFVNGSPVPGYGNGDADTRSMASTSAVSRSTSQFAPPSSAGGFSATPSMNNNNFGASPASGLRPISGQSQQQQSSAAPAEWSPSATPSRSGLKPTSPGSGENGSVGGFSSPTVGASPGVHPGSGDAESAYARRMGIQ